MATKSKTTTTSSADQVDQADTKLSGGDLPVSETGTAAVALGDGGMLEGVGATTGSDSTELPTEGGQANIFDPGTGTYTPLSPEQLDQVAPPPEPEPEREALREPPRDGGSYSFDPSTGIYTRLTTE